MATAEERMRVLKMIDEGRLTPDEGTKLLVALTESRKLPRRPGPGGPSGPPGPRGPQRWLRIRVTDTTTGKTKATVNLPLGMMAAGLNIASKYAPDVAFDELAEAVQSGATGKIIDVVDEQDGEHIEIYIE